MNTLTIPVNTAVAGHESRSSAKTLTTGLGIAGSVVLDFAGVGAVGPGFSDEVFRIFALEHPRTKLRAINLAPAVAAVVWRTMSVAREEVAPAL